MVTVRKGGAKGRRGHVSMAGLRARGWTAELVRRLLGEPDLLRGNPYSASAPRTRLYRVERVEAAERSAEFRALAAAAVRRSIAARAAVRRRRQEVSARVAVARRGAVGAGHGDSTRGAADLHGSVDLHGDADLHGAAEARREAGSGMPGLPAGAPATPESGGAETGREAGGGLPGRPAAAPAEPEIRVRRPGRAADDQEVDLPPPQEPP
ncbi:hypothetical protein ACIRU3_14015 [Streptomyces sp. NPDC101151]|uniref:hypothetical protein n=1 Tax=Streptomyces sp. NPDC101151 TaxID=3366115 RepID=UPI003807BB29